MALTPAEQAYLDSNPDVANDPYYSRNPAEHYARFGRDEGRSFGGSQALGGGGMDMGYHMPFGEGMEGFGHSIAELMHAQQEAYMEQQLAYESAQQQAIQAAGLQSRDSAYAAYLEAAGTATNYITGEIAREQANADLLGIDYTMSPEQRTTRISDYFASIWSEGDQRQLEDLIGRWGEPEGFGGYTIQRGDPSAYVTEGPEAEERVVATSRGLPVPPTILDEETDATLDQQTILGV